MVALDDFTSELVAFLDLAAGTHAFALAGLASIRKDMENMAPLPINPDPRVGWASGDPNIPGSINTRRGWRRSALLRNLEPAGPSALYLGWAWTTLVFDRWEDGFRHRFASAMACKHSDVYSNPMGDLRLIRNDIAHCRGFATMGNSGKCQLLASWLTIGEPIMISQANVASFVELMEKEGAVYKRA